MKRPIPYGIIHTEVPTEEIAEYCPHCKQPMPLHEDSWGYGFAAYKTKPRSEYDIARDKEEREQHAIAALVEKIKKANVDAYEITRQWRGLKLIVQAWEVID